MIPELISFFFTLGGVLGSQWIRFLPEHCNFEGRLAPIEPGRRSIRGRMGLSILSEISNLKGEFTIEKHVIEMLYYIKADISTALSP